MIPEASRVLIRYVVASMGHVLYRTGQHKATKGVIPATVLSGIEGSGGSPPVDPPAESSAPCPG